MRHFLAHIALYAMLGAYETFYIAPAPPKFTITQGVAPKVVRKTKTLVVLLQSDSVCVPCKQARAELKKFGKEWLIGASEDNHIQVVNVESQPGAYQQYGVGSTPAFVLVENGLVTYRHEGYLPAKSIGLIYNKEFPK